MIRILYIFIFLVGGAFGLWLLKGGIGDVIEASQSSGWPTTTGLITHSTVQVSTSHGRHSGTSYEPEITYTYTVSGTQITGSTITPGRHWGYSSSHEAVALFPEGSKPLISYSPSAPAEAVLQPGLHFANFSQLVIGLLVLSFAIPWGLAGVFSTVDYGGKLTFPSGSLAGKVVGFLILAVFVEFFLTWWLCSL